MYGEDLAKILSEELYPGKGPKFGVVKQNSDKSKHLETACMKVHDFGLDFVNLRSEKYADDSRVPTIEIGTPEEDAYRRDLTINALFYNINQNTIEDWTKKGIEDLKEGIIRTPLDPLQTFNDDPLRVLRTIRFTTRFGFKMREEVEAAARNPSILDAMKAKVSNERIGKEIDLMLAGRNPD